MGVIKKIEERTSPAFSPQIIGPSWPPPPFLLYRFLQIFGDFEKTGWFWMTSLSPQTGSQSILIVETR